MIPLGRSTLGEVWASWKGRREEEDGGSENENEEEKRRETRAPGIGLSLAGNRTGQTGQDKTGAGGGRLGGLARQALDAGSWELGAGPHRAPRSVRSSGGTGYLGEWRRCTVLYTTERGGALRSKPSEPETGVRALPLAWQLGQQAPLKPAEADSRSGQLKEEESGTGKPGTWGLREGQLFSNAALRGATDHPLFPFPVRPSAALCASAASRRVLTGPRPAGVRCETARG
ncbi:hypothetical protein EDB80DRAFT_807527 [Ilyonectria destructans]|nr:hypothetical protein EDB80DRAFT_807527 [Ilyonectria destructans]